MSGSEPPSVRPSVRWSVAGATDIGGGRENQDEMFVWERPELGLCVVGVLDGHGREVGRVASQSARDALLQLLDATHMQLLQDPVAWLCNCFVHAHQSIKNAFRSHFVNSGWEVTEAEGGYLTRRKTPSQACTCIHGGTSGSIVAIVGDMLYSANVGDSSATLCSPLPVAAEGLLVDVLDCALPIGSAPPFPMELIPVPKSCTIVVTAEHSPESPEEFYRLRDYRCRTDNPLQPSLFVVYDAPSIDKAMCPPVFALEATGEAKVTNKGRYYKNVRNEWASLVATPPSAHFQDALAFTRSLGDFHLQTYGVSHLPAIRMMSLTQLFSQLRAEREAVGPTVNAAVPLVVSLVVATDGIWDNWSYEDVTKFVMDESCLRAVLPIENNVSGPATAATGSSTSTGGVRGVQRVANSFLKRNAIFARKNFGSDADNATGIILYLEQINTGC